MLAASLYTARPTPTPSTPHVCAPQAQAPVTAAHAMACPRSAPLANLAHSAHLRLIELHDQPVRTSGHLWVGQQFLRVSTGAHGLRRVNRDSQSALVPVANISPTSVSRAIALADLAAPVRNQGLRPLRPAQHGAHSTRHSASDNAPAVMYPSAVLKNQIGRGGQCRARNQVGQPKSSLAALRAKDTR